jgi:hypothetical protein
MELFGEYHAVLRIVIVDIKGKTRQTADSVIVYSRRKKTWPVFGSALLLNPLR